MQQHPRNDPAKRRTLRLLGGAALVAGAAPGLALAEALQATPRQTAGPFYPMELPLDDDNDLIQVAGGTGLAEGRHMDLQGRLLDSSGRPLAGRRIEIWQCDANGRYRHPRDRGGLDPDPNFQGHGHFVTDDEGRYRFRTIRPVPYPGRTPHIHMAVFRPGQSAFTTQMYLPDEPGNAEDFLFRRIPVEKRELVVAKLGKPSKLDVLAARFDLVLG